MFKGLERITKYIFRKAYKVMKKIIFSDRFRLTRAVLNRTKTMARQLLKDGTPLGNWNETAKHLPYKVGEVVAIAQGYQEILECFPTYNDILLDETKNDGSLYKQYKSGRYNKMFVKAALMPHHIKITDAKVERLQEISNEDCLREGVRPYYDNKDDMFFISKSFGGTSVMSFPVAREAFEYIIDEIYGKGTWDSNPWVVAYSFERVD
jgi:hypothetical protein